MTEETQSMYVGCKNQQIQRLYCMLCAKIDKIFNWFDSCRQERTDVLYKNKREPTQADAFSPAMSCRLYILRVYCLNLFSSSSRAR